MTDTTTPPNDRKHKWSETAPRYCLNCNAPMSDLVQERCTPVSPAQPPNDSVEETAKEFESSLAEVLEQKFPKLNADDTTKQSPNNRSQALTLYAQACVMNRAALNRVREKERSRLLMELRKCYLGNYKLQDGSRKVEIQMTERMFEEMRSPNTTEEKER